jgi:hypothetical protein
VELELAGDPGPRRERRPNDEVFVLAGGRPPIPELERAGVSFDPRLRPPPVALGEQGSGLLRALAVGLVLALGTLAFALYFRDYYTLPTADRPSHPLHDLLRPGLGFGLACGVLSTVLIAVNLSYLLRRSRRAGFRFGALPHWLSAHVATGLLALLTALLHGALAPGDSVGGQAFWVLVVLCSTGALGRYLYAYLPRAANGRELELSEVRSNLASLAAGFDGAGRHFGERVRAQIEQLIAGRRWGGSAPARLAALCGAEFALRRSLHRLRREGLESGLDAQQVDSTLGLARQAHRAALLAAHLEDLRGLLASWRWLHRWGALLLVLLLVLHVVYALLYSARFFDGGLT